MTLVSTHERRYAADGAGAAPAYLWLFLAGLAFSMFSGNSGYLGLPTNLDRPLLLFVVVLLVLDPRRPTPRLRAFHVVGTLLVAWTAWSWLSTGSLLDSAKAFALADRIILPLVMFIVGPLIFDTPARRSILVKFLVLLGVYLGIMGVAQFFGLDQLLVPRYMANDLIGIQADRARGPFLASEPMGMVAAITMTASAIAIYRERGRWRTLSIFSAGLSLSVVVLCLTRSVWLGTALAALAAIALVPVLRRAAPAIVAVVVGAVLLVAATAPSITLQIQERFTTERSLYDRVLTNEAAVRVIDAHPVSGIGWGNFLARANSLVRQADTIPFTNTSIEVHNVFLSRAAETGVIGAVLLALALYFGPLTAIFRSSSDADSAAWRLATLAVMFVWLVPSLTSPNPYPLPNFLFWLIAGVAGGKYFSLSRSTHRANLGDE